MKTALTHLPDYKRAELERVVELVLAACKPEILILFGSHARGDWVEDRHFEGNVLVEYRSDYDLYALMRIAKHCDRLLLEPSLHRRFDAVSRTPVSLIADTVRHFNDSLERGRYFYVDVAKEGIVLHDSRRFAISAPRELSREEQWEEANANYEYWFDRAESFFRTYQLTFDIGEFITAAFQLHQAVEHCTTTILLVLTGYTPKGHDIAKRLQHCASCERRFGNVFPRSSAEDKHRFELLREAYIGARYKKGYSITPDDLARLAVHTRVLLDLARDVCQLRIRSLRD